jgi:hypothetical protein
MGLLQRIAWADAQEKIHEERQSKYERDARHLDAMGDTSRAMRFMDGAIAEGHYILYYLQVRDQARYDLAQRYLSQGKTAAAVQNLRLVERSQGGTSQLGAAARAQLQQLGQW